MKIDIVMPQLGESVAEGTILKWHKKVGDKVAKDEVIYEVSTDKIDTEIPSPASGVLTEILVPEEKTVDVGTVVARIDAGEEKSKGTPPSVDPSTQKEKPHMGGESGKQETRLISRVRAAHVSTAAFGTSQGKIFLSPVVRKMIQTHGVAEAELHRVPGSGAHGRITRKDMETYLQQRGVQPVVRVSVPVAQKAQKVGGVASIDHPIPKFAGDKVEKMSNMRKKIAQHMVMSRHTSAHCQLFHEADVTHMVRYRQLYAEEFLSHGVKLTVTPLFIRPLMKAIREFPILNASVNGDEIIYHEHIHMGIAVALEKGLIVPVIRNAENLNLLGLTRAVQDLSGRARQNKLTVDELQGGTFTITNPGMYGTLLSAPIINQPQVAIFSPGAIQKRVVVMDDSSWAIRDMVYLSLSFDHRVIDGAVAGAFLSSLTQKLEQDFLLDDE